MGQALRGRWNALENILRRQSPWLIAYSGGCDSAFLIAAARRLLGADGVLAVTAVSASLAAREKSEARVLAERLQIRHRFLETHELENPGYAANPSNRCFFCKNELYSRLAPWAAAEKRTLGDGLNASDRSDYRPGVEAARLWKVAHPLDEAQLTKRDIRILSRALKLPTWNKPASPCLASRLPYGTPVTEAALGQIERAESVLSAEGFRDVRVRHYGRAARIEVPLKELPRLQEALRWQKIVMQFHTVGYSEVIVDPRGLVRGRLNEPLERAREAEKNIF